MAYSSGVQFVWKGQSIATQLEAAIEAGMEDTAHAAEQNAKDRARVDTGEMRASIEATVTRSGSGVSMTLSVGTDHGIFNELGTSRMPAQPMVRPAIDQEGPKLGARIKAHLGSLR